MLECPAYEWPHGTALLLQPGQLGRVRLARGGVRVVEQTQQLTNLSLVYCALSGEGHL